MSDNIEHVLEETRTFDPPNAFRSKAQIKSSEDYKKLYDHSIEDPDSFWTSIASELHWFKKWDR
ncbi:MAG: acetyl-coenzyme A synthetase N-terminal domain-containing protein, partial [Candidatus Hydrogenedentota bacterium]